MTVFKHGDHHTGSHCLPRMNSSVLSWQPCLANDLKVKQLLVTDRLPIAQYLWTRRSIPGSKLLLFGPLNIATALFTDYVVTRTLAATGALMCVGQYIAMSQTRREGMRLI